MRNYREKAQLAKEMMCELALKGRNAKIIYDENGEPVEISHKAIAAYEKAMRWQKLSREAGINGDPMPEEIPARYQDHPVFVSAYEFGKKCAEVARARGIDQ
jgi:hypothetical protein